ncbi:MAG: hypothetical protein MUC94_18165 [bacterium]|nr:hypothetical protein [bacterium]
MNKHDIRWVQRNVKKYNSFPGKCGYRHPGCTAGNHVHKFQRSCEYRIKVPATKRNTDCYHHTAFMVRRDAELANGYGQIVHTLQVDTEGGTRRMKYADSDCIFRII